MRTLGTGFIAGGAIVVIAYFLVCTATQEHSVLCALYSCCSFEDLTPSASPTTGAVTIEAVTGVLGGGVVDPIGSL
jgi:hypothetical protein